LKAFHRIQIFTFLGNYWKHKVNQFILQRQYVLLAKESIDFVQISLQSLKWWFCWWTY
jgi:hypothetical protein